MVTDLDAGGAGAIAADQIHEPGVMIKGMSRAIALSPTTVPRLTVAVKICGKAIEFSINDSPMPEAAPTTVLMSIAWQLY